MVNYYRSTEVDKVIATNSSSCVIITKSQQSVTQTIYFFPFKNTSEVYAEITEEEFTAEHDAMLARTIDILERKGNGIRALLPDAKQ